VKSANDILFEPNFVETAKTFLQWFHKHKDCTVGMPSKLHRFKELKLDKAGLFLCSHQWEMPENTDLSSITLPDDFNKLFGCSVMKRPQGQSTQIFSNEWINKVHGFDERFRFNYDTDLWKRAKTTGLADWWSLSYSGNFFRSVKPLINMETHTLHQWHNTTQRGKVLMYNIRSSCYRSLMKWREIYHDPSNYTQETVVRNGDSWGLI
jgi:hypothetical protein